MRSGQNEVRDPGLALPQDAKAWLAFTRNALRQQEWDKAFIGAKRAFELEPTDVEALLYYSDVLGNHGRFREQWQLLEQALRLDCCENPALHIVIGLWQLRAGDYSNGARNFLSWKAKEDVFSRIPIPLWNGEALESKGIVLLPYWLGSGLGDAISLLPFVQKFARRAQQQGGKILWCCQDALETIFRRSLAAQSEVLFFTTPGRISPCQLPKAHPYEEQFRGLTLVKSSLMSLVSHIREPITRGFPYLISDSIKVETWRERLSSDKGLKIGFSWTGQYSHPRNSLRSIPIDDLLEALKDIPGVIFYSLHIGDSPSAMRDFTKEFATIDDTAAFVSNLDLVIAADVMIAHLAGAMDIPTWVLVDLNPHHTWGRVGKETPWYRSVRVYRQRAFRSWTSVFEEVRTDLAKHADGKPEIRVLDKGQIKEL